MNWCENVKIILFIKGKEYYLYLENDLINSLILVVVSVTKNNTHFIDL